MIASNDIHQQRATTPGSSGSAGVAQKNSFGERHKAGRERSPSSSFDSSSGMLASRPGCLVASHVCLRACVLKTRFLTRLSSFSWPRLFASEAISRQKKNWCCVVVVWKEEKHRSPRTRNNIYLGLGRSSWQGLSIWEHSSSLRDDAPHSLDPESFLFHALDRKPISPPERPAG